MGTSPPRREIQGNDEKQTSVYIVVYNNIFLERLPIPVPGGFTMSITIPKTIGHFVNGRSIPGSGGRYGNVYNPASGEVTGRVSFAGKNEVEEAVSAAAAAFPAWAATPPLRRAKVLFRVKELLDRHAEELSALITAEHGKGPRGGRGC